METIKDQLRAYLKKKKIKPSHLAHKAGISPSIISLFLANKRGMTVDTWEKIREALK
jgi:hypothetical protein